MKSTVFTAEKQSTDFSRTLWPEAGFSRTLSLRPISLVLFVPKSKLPKSRVLSCASGVKTTGSIEMSRTLWLECAKKRFSFASGQTARDFPQKALSEGKKSRTVQPKHKKSRTLWPGGKKSCTVCPQAGQAVKGRPHTQNSGKCWPATSF